MQNFPRVNGLENRGGLSQPPGMGRGVQNSLAWEGLTLQQTGIPIHYRKCLKIRNQFMIIFVDD